MVVNSLQSQAYGFRHDTPQGQWRWTTRVDLSGSVPAYIVEDIASPWGVLRDTIPIPGDVVEAMAASISEIRTQFPPAILLGADLVFRVTEGAGFSPSQQATLTNSGVYGSLLGASLTSDAAYVVVTPSELGGLAYQQTGTFEVAVDSTYLLAADSPYTHAIEVQDPAASNTPQTLTVTVEVTPKATIAVTPTGLSFSAVKPLVGPFNPIPSQVITVSNTGPAGSVLEWQVQQVGCSSWLSAFAPVSGTLEAGESEQVTVVVAPPQNLQRGTYTETLRFSGFSENQFVDALITLTVT